MTPHMENPATEGGAFAGSHLVWRDEAKTTVAPLRTPDGSPVFRVVDVPPAPQRVGMDAAAPARVFPGRVVEGGFPTAPRQFAGRLVEPSLAMIDTGGTKQNRR